MSAAPWSSRSLEQPLLCCAKGCSDILPDDVGDNNDVIAGDKLPFVTGPDPDS